MQDFKVFDRFVINDCLIFSCICEECQKLYFYRAYSGDMLDFYYCNKCKNNESTKIQDRRSAGKQ